MSPEIWSKYSPSMETTTAAARQESGHSDGADDQPTDESKPEDGVKDGDNPAEDGDKPAEDGDKPAEDGDKPAEDGDKPAEE